MSRIFIDMGRTTSPDGSSNWTRARITSTHGLWQAFTCTHHVISKVRQRELRQHGITLNEAVVLFTILRLKGRATPAAISRQLFWERHTVSEQLKSMEGKELIRKVRDLGRRNLIRVEVTERGVEVYRKLAWRKSTGETMSALTREERLELLALLAKLRARALHKLGAHGSDPLLPLDPNRANA